MTQIPASEGDVHIQGTRDDMFDHLAENRDTRCIGLSFPNLGCRVMIKVTESSPADALFYDIIVLCPGDENHEEHPVDGRQMQTREEIEDLLDNLRGQDQLQGFIAAVMSGEMG